MPDDELLSIQPVHLKMPVEAVVSRAGVRANCDVCGEEIINEREVRRDGATLCRACAGEGYYDLLASSFPCLSLREPNWPERLSVNNPLTAHRHVSPILE